MIREMRSIKLVCMLLVDHVTNIKALIKEDA